MAVSIGCYFLTTCAITACCIDHTKFIGKSHGHAVSSLIIFPLHAPQVFQDSVKMSEDGEKVLEGKDVE